MVRTLTLLAAIGAALHCPADESSERTLTHIAFGSCAHQERPLPIFDAIVAAEPDLFLWLGDNIYADTREIEVMRDKYRKMAAVPGFQKLKEQCEFMATWDDHDYGENDAGVEYPLKAESQQELLDFFEVPQDSFRREREGVYHAKTFGPEGKRVQVIMLDTRYFRSPLKTGQISPGVRGYLPNTDEGTTFLGDEQWKWFEERLREPAELRIIGSSVQVVPQDHRFEKWMNIPGERDRLFGLIRETGAEGVVFISGDRHLAELSMMDGKVGYPIYDLTSSGLNQASPVWRPLEENRHRVATMAFGNNFGLITVDWDRPDPLVGLQIRDQDGEVTIRQELPLSVLKRGTIMGGPEVPPEVVPGILSVEEAAAKPNAICTVELEVKSTGQSRDGGVVFLNSMEDYRDPKNFTVALMVSGLKDQYQNLDRDTFAGKTVRVTGLVERTQFGPRLTIREADKLKAVVE